MVTKQCHGIEMSYILTSVTDSRTLKRLQSTSFQGGAPSAYGTLLYIKEERINSSQSAVDDSVILTWQFWVKDTEIKAWINTQWMIRGKNATQELLDKEIMTKESDSIRTPRVWTSKGATNFLLGKIQWWSLSDFSTTIFSHFSPHMSPFQLGSTVSFMCK